MVVIRVELHLELLVGPYECVDVLHGMLHMHIIVACAVDDEEFSVEIFGPRYERGGVISAVVDLRAAHVAFGVCAVVEPPVGDGCDGDARFEGMVMPAHGEERLVSAVAPAHDGHTCAVDVGLLCSPVSGCDEVFGLFES